MIEYRNAAGDLAERDLEGFFEDWPDPPSPATHLRLLRESHAIVLAIDTADRTVAGFITAISDGVLAAYIPLLEVRATYQGRGIGSELVHRILSRFRDLYMIDVMCDAPVQAFYERAGMTLACGASVRNFDRQSGRVE